MKLKTNYRLGYVITDELTIEQTPKAYVPVPKKDLNSALHNALTNVLSGHYLKYKTNRLGNTVFHYDYTPIEFE